MMLPTLLAAMTLLAEAAPSKPVEVVVVDEAPPPGPEAAVGGVIAPAIMPRGSTSMYALLGAPEVGGGFRQGFAQAEFEARLMLNYLEASAVFEVGGKIAVYRKGLLEFVPSLFLGLAADSGSTYYDKQNFAYVAVRPRAALTTGIRFTETATGLFIIDVPWAIPVTNHAAGGQFTPTIGFGAEMMLGKTLSGLLLGQAGLDVIKAPLGVTQVRPAWAIRLGLGFRLF